jgi:hypothetical protein
MIMWTVKAAAVLALPMVRLRQLERSLLRRDGYLHPKGRNDNNTSMLFEKSVHSHSNRATYFHRYKPRQASGNTTALW